MKRATGMRRTVAALKGIALTARSAVEAREGKAALYFHLNSIREYAEDALNAIAAAKRIERKRCVRPLCDSCTPETRRFPADACPGDSPR